MNYDEYINEVEKSSNDEVVSKLAEHLVNWKLDETNVITLAKSTERFFGNSWIQNLDTHNHLYKLWSDFKKEAIDNIGGMTMNERLYWFGLFDQFEICQSEMNKKAIYAKLLAST